MLVGELLIELTRRQLDLLVAVGEGNGLSDLARLRIVSAVAQVDRLILLVFGSLHKFAWRLALLKERVEHQEVVLRTQLVEEALRYSAALV